LLIMRINSYFMVSQFITILLLLAACDAVYLVRGTVSELVAEQKSERLSSGYLNGVTIDLSYVVDKKGHVGPVLNDHFYSNKYGKYKTSFIWSPFGLGHDVFLEFVKPGYARKKVFVDVDSKDPDVTVEHCAEKTPYRGCWVIDVGLTREMDSKAKP